MNTKINSNSLLLLLIFLITQNLNAQFINGYSNALHGETIKYESPHPTANEALLVRANTGDMFIEWETAPVQYQSPDEIIRFRWLAGIGCNLGNKKFPLFVNDSLFFTLQSTADTAWQIKNKNGSSINFKLEMIDKANDNFGYITLSIPAKYLKQGLPVRLKLLGENAGSNAWFMTFKFSMETNVLITPLQALIKEVGNLKQPVRIDLSYFGNDSIAMVTVDNQSFNQHIGYGINSFLASIQPQRETKSINISIDVNGKRIADEKVTVNPVVQREIYIIHHSHTDIGYTQLQTEVEKKHIGYIDKAINICEQFKDYPEEARFKWNIEVTWPLIKYLEKVNHEQKGKFIAAVKNGSIGISGCFANEMTGLSRQEELLNYYDFTRHLKTEYGFDIRTSAITDIPGSAWGMVSAQSQSGIKYYTSGPNYMPNLPQRGDRIGYILVEWGDKPFYWKSKSGEEKILFWVAGRGYSMFHGGSMGTMQFVGEKKLLEYMNELYDKKYPYGIVQVRYTIGGDNGPPDDTLPGFVKRWNDKYESPKLVISTANQMFEKFEERYGNMLPVISGDFTPAWEDGTISSAMETAMNRNTAEELNISSTIWSLTNPKDYPHKLFFDAWENVLLYTEHTWGAYNSVSDPDAESVKAQWEIKKSYAENAREISKEIFNGLSRTAQNKPIESIDIVNHNSWERTDIIYIERPEKLKGNLAFDENGTLLPSQLLNDGRLAVHVKNIPALGSKRIFFKAGLGDYPGGSFAKNNILENRFFKIEIDTAKGTIASIKWNGKELVDNTHNFGMNEFIYVPGIDPVKAVVPSDNKIKITDAGPLVATIRIESEAEGCNKLIRDISLFDGCDYIQITNTIDKKAVREKEGVHFSFPFNVENGEVTIDLPFGEMKPDDDQISGSCKNHISLQRWVEIENESYGVAFVTADAPLIELGGITAEIWNMYPDGPWLKELPKTQAVYSYLMNNYWHTNYKADQEGISTYKYFIRPHVGESNHVSSHRFSIERTQPLIVFNNSKENIKKYFGVESKSANLFMLKALKNSDGLLAGFYNPSNLEAAVNLTTDKKYLSAMYMSNLFEEKISEVKDQIIIPPFATRYVRMDFK